MLTSTLGTFDANGSWIARIFRKLTLVKYVKIHVSGASRIGDAEVDYIIEYLPAEEDPITGAWADVGVTEVDGLANPDSVEFTLADPIACIGIRVRYTGASTNKTIAAFQAKTSTINWSLASYQRSLQGIDFNFEPTVTLIDGTELNNPRSITDGYRDLGSEMWIPELEAYLETSNLGDITIEASADGVDWRTPWTIAEGPEIDINQSDEVFVTDGTAISEGVNAYKVWGNTGAPRSDQCLVLIPLTSLQPDTNIIAGHLKSIELWLGTSNGLGSNNHVDVMIARPIDTGQNQLHLVGDIALTDSFGEITFDVGDYGLFRKFMFSTFPDTGIGLPSGISPRDYLALAITYSGSGGTRNLFIAASNPATGSPIGYSDFDGSRTNSYTACTNLAYMDGDLVCLLRLVGFEYYLATPAAGEENCRYFRITVAQPAPKENRIAYGVGAFAPMNPEGFLDFRIDSADANDINSIPYSNAGPGSTMDFQVVHKIPDADGDVPVEVDSFRVSIDPDGSPASFLTQVAVNSIGPWKTHCVNNDISAEVDGSKTGQCLVGNSNYLRTKDLKAGVVGCGQLCNAYNGGAGEFAQDSLTKVLGAPVEFGDTCGTVYYRTYIPEDSGFSTTETRAGRIMVALQADEISAG